MASLLLWKGSWRWRGFRGLKLAANPSNSLNAHDVTEYGAISTPLILVADDSRTILSMVASRLERSGYEVVTATNGEEALRLSEERRPSLAILDVEMPKLDGYEVTRRLRANELTATIPIVLLTARDSEEERAAGLEAGATDYITKPFSPQELEARVEQVLGRR
jgi:two-component system alkaline phosphatase synthesis response regulator PhoP